MEIDEQRVREFIEAYHDEFNEKLPATEARIVLAQLVELYAHIARPLPTDTLVCTEDGSSRSRPCWAHNDKGAISGAVF